MAERILKFPHCGLIPYRRQNEIFLAKKSCFLFQKFDSNCTISSISARWIVWKLIEEGRSTITNLDRVCLETIFNRFGTSLSTKTYFCIHNFSQRFGVGIAFADVATYICSTVLIWNNCPRDLSSSRFFKSIPIGSLPIRIGT